LSFEKRCDGSPDCIDESDETNCELVVINKKIYNKESPPIPKNAERASVNVDFTIISIGSIDEIEMTVVVTFNLVLTW